MRPTFLLPALTLALASCGGGADPADLVDSGERQLAAGDADAAADDFEAALDAVEPGDPLYVRARLGAVEAWAKTDPDRASEAFLELARSQPEEVGDRDFNRVAGRMADAGHLAQATSLLAAGKEAYPESVHLDRLGEKLAQQAKSAGASDAIEELRSLGYIGD